MGYRWPGGSYRALLMDVTARSFLIHSQPLIFHPPSFSRCPLLFFFFLSSTVNKFYFPFPALWNTSSCYCFIWTWFSLRALTLASFSGKCCSLSQAPPVLQVSHKPWAVRFIYLGSPVFLLSSPSSTLPLKIPAPWRSYFSSTWLLLTLWSLLLANVDFDISS